MKTPKEILEQHFGSDLYQLDSIEIAMREYAVLACIEQRKACSLWIEDSIVLSCPLITDEENGKAINEKLNK